MTGLVSVVAITAALVANATGGRLTAGSPDVVFASVSIDSRTVAAGALFVAIKGDRFDGHDYTGVALERGATGLPVSRALHARGDHQRNDTLALQDLARNPPDGRDRRAITERRQDFYERKRPTRWPRAIGYQNRATEQSHRSAADADRTRQDRNGRRASA